MFSDIISELSSLGYFAPVFSFLLGALQAIFPYIPFVVLAGTNGIVFGFYMGLLITFSSAVCGALISFWFARKWGQNWVLHKFGASYGQQIERFSSEYGFRTVLIARLIPIIPAPLINILSGVSKISFRSFMLASFIGIFPYTLFYTSVGTGLSRVENVRFVAIIVIIVFTLGLFLKYSWGKSRK